MSNVKFRINFSFRFFMVKVLKTTLYDFITNICQNRFMICVLAHFLNKLD